MALPVLLIQLRIRRIPRPFATSFFYPLRHATSEQEADKATRPQLFDTTPDYEIKTENLLNLCQLAKGSQKGNDEPFRNKNEPYTTQSRLRIRIVIIQW